MMSPDVPRILLADKTGNSKQSTADSHRDQIITERKCRRCVAVASDIGPSAPRWRVMSHLAGTGCRVITVFAHIGPR
ncbi:hypothetical protein J6590_067508 [Homalodisca vitripennis]|nr:hypothetical protein J6590_067508 [Homalodisca vitripennis]